MNNITNKFWNKSNLLLIYVLTFFVTYNFINGRNVFKSIDSNYQEFTIKENKTQLNNSFKNSKDLFNIEIQELAEDLDQEDHNQQDSNVLFLKNSIYSFESNYLFRSEINTKKSLPKYFFSTHLPFFILFNQLKVYFN